MDNSTDMTAQRRLTLTTEHGPATRYKDTGGALRAVGARGQLHPRDAVAFTYPTRAAAEAYAQANADHWGHPTLGPVATGGRWLSVIDLRPAFTRIDEGADRETVRRYTPTDPALPDDYDPTATTTPA